MTECYFDIQLDMLPYILSVFTCSARATAWVQASQQGHLTWYALVYCRHRAIAMHELSDKAVSKKSSNIVGHVPMVSCMYF